MPASVLSCDRIRNGRPVTKNITESYQDDGHGLPKLFLFSDYSARKADWLTRDEYKVEEFIPDRPFDGRAFLLHRSAAAIAKDAKRNDGSVPDASYGVFIARNGQDNLCDCRGFQVHGHCKHVDALRGLIESGQIDEPGADSPQVPFPSPEQVQADAKIDSPF